MMVETFGKRGWMNQIRNRRITRTYLYVFPAKKIAPNRPPSPSDFDESTSLEKWKEGRGGG
jgi:hypothetical protein